MKIFLNAGHGGIDSGAVSRSGTKEKDICLNICNILSKLLKTKGFQVELYQQKNSYFEISKQENKSKSNLFVSIHCNSSTSQTANGIETLYNPKSTKGKRLAQCVNDSLVLATKLTDRGIKSRDDLHVLNRTLATAILVECAFLSNPKEEALLKHSPEIFAQAICNGIIKYNSLCV